jgi:lysophospholipase L1-like esterase
MTLLLIPIVVGCGSRPPAREQKKENPSVTSSSPLNPGPILYVALGDSTGVGQGARYGGYVDRLFRKLVVKRAGSRLINLCVSGSTTTDVIRGQLDEGIAAKPELVTLGVGINDIGHGLSLQEFARNYQTILERLKRETQAVVIVTNIPDISSGPRIPLPMRNQYQQEIIAFNQKLQEIASSLGAIVFDSYTITHEQLPSHPEYFSADGFHPSDDGYELWAEQMWPTLEVVIGGQ